MMALKLTVNVQCHVLNNSHLSAQFPFPSPPLTINIIIYSQLHACKSFMIKPILKAF